MKRAKVGDVFEIPLLDGRKGYGQYVFRDDNHGPLIQVYDLIVNNEEDIDIETIIESPALFPPVFTGVFAAIRQGLWKVVGNTPVKDFIYPKFVNTFWDDKTGKARSWFLWDGEKETKLGWELPEEYKNLEFEIVWDPHGISERIENGGEMLWPFKDLVENNAYTPLKKATDDE